MSRLEDMLEDITVPVRTGTITREVLPSGPWRLCAGEMDGIETMIAVSPFHPARFYRDGRRIDIWSGELGQ